MGNDPTRSVLDPDLVLQKGRNVAVLGSGAFPTSSPANPTLTLHGFILASPKIAPECAQQLSELIIAFSETPEAKTFMDLILAKSFMPLSSDDLIPYRPFTGFIKSLIGASNGSRTGGPIEVNSNLSK
jgi:hypothetical protein